MPTYYDYGDAGYGTDPSGPDVPGGSGNYNTGGVLDGINGAVNTLGNIFTTGLNAFRSFVNTKDATEKPKDPTPTNWSPLLIGGGVLAILIVFLVSRRK